MSSLSKAIVTKITNLSKHPNADSLTMTSIDGFNVIFKTGKHNIGDLVVYIKPDSYVDTSIPEFSFLENKNHIKIKKLRGIISYGLLIQARPEFFEGQDVTNILNVKSYVINSDLPSSEFAESPQANMKYTDIESLRKYHHLLEPGEPIIVLEKIHGANSRFIFENNKLFVGTHNTWLKPGNNPWWNASSVLDLENTLRRYENYIFFGEVYGWIADLKYNHPQGQNSLLFFDIFDVSSGKYLDYHHFLDIIANLWPTAVPAVPKLYEGPYINYQHLLEMAEGKSIIANNIREGIVVRPKYERYDNKVGRVILKLHGNDFLSRA